MEFNDTGWVEVLLITCLLQGNREIEGIELPSGVPPYLMEGYIFTSFILQGFVRIYWCY